MGGFMAGVGNALGGAMTGVGSFMGPLIGGGSAMGNVAGPGIMNFLNNIFQNKLLQQLLAAEGADLMGNTPGKNIGGAIQQNIASQNYMKVLEKMLGGQIPDGGKITQDSKGMTIAIPPPPMPSPQQPTFQTGSILPAINRGLSSGLWQGTNNADLSGLPMPDFLSKINPFKIPTYGL